MGKIDFLKQKLNKLRHPIFVDYPVEPRTRWGFGKPVHPILERRLARSEQACLDLIRGIDYAPRLRDIPLEGPQTAQQDKGQPFWHNEWISPLDGISLTEIIRRHKPRTYLEVGSGMSTRFARHAVGMHGLVTKIVSIDPNPRVEIDDLCDGVVRKRLEDCVGSELPRLGPGDVFFVDNSHRAFQNSDVTVFFLEILPALPPGVIVGIHDIYLPADYPPEWLDRYYSEQYLLAAWLLANPLMPEVLWPVFHSCSMESTRKELNRLLEKVFPPGTPGHAQYAKPGGGAFWFRTS